MGHHITRTVGAGVGAPATREAVRIARRRAARSGTSAGSVRAERGFNQANIWVTATGYSRATDYWVRLSRFKRER
jgi:hypothetical protein